MRANKNLPCALQLHADPWLICILSKANKNRKSILLPQNTKKILISKFRGLQGLRKELKFLNNNLHMPKMLNFVHWYWKLHNRYLHYHCELHITFKILIWKIAIFGPLKWKKIESLFTEAKFIQEIQIKKSICWSKRISNNLACIHLAS